MNEENYTCEICCENYDLKTPLKLPKKVPCCNKTFCLKCLNEIYEKNNQTLKCPYCRKITLTSPKYFKDNTLIFSRFLICCNCHEKVPQNQLYFYQNNNEIKIKCQHCENGDMKLNDILPEFVSEINNNLIDYEKECNISVIEDIKKEIKKEIEEWFNKIINNLIESISNKILNEFNKVWQIEKKENEFKNMINELNKNNKYLYAFIEDIPTKNFDTKNILNCMKYYNDNISIIKNEYKFLRKFRELIKNKKLIRLNPNFDINKIEENFIILVNKKQNKDKNNNINFNNNLENNNDENFFVNDKMILELDKLIIKPKLEYSLSAQRV